MIGSPPYRGVAIASSGRSPKANATEPADSNATLAVLPVSNVGGDPREQYFGDGVIREVITALSRFAGLTVIAANSSFQFRGDNPDVDRVRRELGVRYVAFIGVQRAGETRSRIRTTDRCRQTLAALGGTL